MANLFVRIAKGKTATSFFRAGHSFTKEWQAVEVDDATASRLYAEQMLEVMDVNPDDIAQPIAVEVSQTETEQTENSGAEQIPQEQIALNDTAGSQAIEPDSTVNTTEQTENSGAEAEQANATVKKKGKS